MDEVLVEEAVEKYLHERMGRGKKTAAERFLSYAYMTYHGEDLRAFMAAVVRSCRYSIDYLKVMENPLKGPEFPWFFALLVVGIFSSYLMSQESYRILGILLISGTFLNGGLLISAVVRKWKEIGVLIAMYREVAELAEKEAHG